MSLRTKVNWLFGIFLLLDVIFLFAINTYSVNNFKTHIADINEQTLKNTTESWDKSLGNAGTYIMNISYQERNVLQPLMTGNDCNKLDYILAYNEIRKRFSDDLDYYGIMSAYFVYVGQNDDLIITNRNGADKYTEYEDRIKSYCTDNSIWHQMKLDNGYHLIKSINVGYSTYIGVIMDIDDMADYLNELYPDAGPWFRIINDEGTVLYDNSEDDSRVGLIRLDSKIRSVGLTVEECIPGRWLYKQIPYYSFALLLCISLCMVILMVIFYILQYNAIQKPIDLLIKSVKKVESGDMNARVEEQSSPEFNYLIRSYNDMLDKIYDLKLDIAETRLKEKYAKLKQLQAQINPHFFMNSLNLISSLSALQDHETVSRLVYHLSDYFRFAVQNTEISTTLEREINHVKTCLEIHKIRFPQNLEYECSMPPEVKNIRIPPLTIQPLIENAVIHGMKTERNRIFCVSVKIGMSDEYLEVTVSDNGCGFSKERIDYIRNGLGDSKETEHIGIKNVYLRLNMFFDGGVDMDFGNNVQGGAEVIIRIPRQKISEVERLV